MDKQARTQGSVPAGSGWSSERWVDDEFAWQIDKHLRATVRKRRSWRVPTLFGDITLDLHAQVDGLRVGFLYDGLTDAPGFAGIWQDAALVGAGAVDVVYRLRRGDLERHLEDVLYLISRADMALFSARGEINLDQLATFWAKRSRIREQLQVHYPEPRSEEDCDPSGDPDDADAVVEPILRPDGDCLSMVRRERARLQIPYRFARDSGLRSIDAVMERYGAEVFEATED